MQLLKHGQLDAKVGSSVGGRYLYQVIRGLWYLNLFSVRKSEIPWGVNRAIAGSSPIYWNEMVVLNVRCFSDITKRDDWLRWRASFWDGLKPATNPDLGMGKLRDIESKGVGAYHLKRL